MIDQNPAHYTAWEFRRKCLKALKKDLVAELRFIEVCTTTPYRTTTQHTHARTHTHTCVCALFAQGIAYDSPKNYQIWYHRRAVVELLGDPSAELQVRAP